MCIKNRDVHPVLLAVAQVVRWTEVHVIATRRGLEHGGSHGHLLVEDDREVHLGHVRDRCRGARLAEVKTAHPLDQIGL